MTEFTEGSRLGEESLSPIQVWQLEIINDILSNGLRPSAELLENSRQGLTSKTTKSIYIHTCLIEKIKGRFGITDWKRVETDLKKKLYGDLWSIFPVIAERADYSVANVSELPTETLEERFLNSLLVVFGAWPSLGVSASGENYWYDPDGNEIIDRQRPSIKGPISPNIFLKVFLPDQVKRRFEEHIINPLNILLVGVPLKKAVVFGGSGVAHRRELVVPDYESEIFRLLKVTRTPLAIHGVRLPIRDDEKFKSK